MQTNPDIALKILQTAATMAEQYPSTPVIREHAAAAGGQYELHCQSLEELVHVLMRPAEAGFEHLFDVALSEYSVDDIGALRGLALVAVDTARALGLKTKLVKKNNGLFTLENMERGETGEYTHKMQRLPGYHEWIVIEMDRFGYRGAAPIAHRHRPNDVKLYDLRYATLALLTAQSLRNVSPQPEDLLQALEQVPEEERNNLIQDPHFCFQSFHQAVSTIVSAAGRSEVFSVRLHKEDFKAGKPCGKDVRLIGTAKSIWSMAQNLNLKVRLRRHNNGLCTRQDFTRNELGFYEHPLVKLEGYQEWWALVVTKPQVDTSQSYIPHHT